MLNGIRRWIHNRSARAAARVEQNFIQVAGRFREQFPGPLARLPPWKGYVARRNPADHPNVGSWPISLSENQTTAPRVRTEREHIDSSRMNAHGLKGSPGCYGGFKGPA